jgi:hypothetical protein
MNAADPLPAALDDLLRAAAKLPVCDGAAKLHALVARVQSVIEQQQDPLSTTEALASAATDALEHDPWVQFERAAQRLLDAAGLAAPTTAGLGPALPFPPA